MDNWVNVEWLLRNTDKWWNGLNEDKSLPRAYIRGILVRHVVKFNTWLEEEDIMIIPQDYTEFHQFRVSSTQPVELEYLLSVSVAPGTDAPPVEQAVPAQRDTDNLSERAQVVEDAVQEDGLHDFLLDVIEVADMFGVPIIWENMPPTLTEDGQEMDEWDEDVWGDDDWEDWDDMTMPQPINHAGRRADYKTWRDNARVLGFRPYIPLYTLAADVATFEGEVYRIINPRDLILHDDIPF